MSLPLRFSVQRGPRSSHKAVQLVRAYFGLTQDWLAGFLGVPRAAVSMEESQGHGLPAAATLAMLPFYQGLPAPEGPAPEPPATPSAASLTANRPVLEKRHQALELELRQLNRQQERVRIRLRQVRLRLQTLPALLMALPPPPADARPRRYLGYWITDAPDQLRTDEAALALLDLRQRVLEFELAEIGKLLG